MTEINMHTAKQSNRFMLFMMANQIVIVFVISGFFSRQFSALPQWGQVLVSQSLVFLVPCAVVAVMFRGRLRELFPFRNIGAVNAVMIAGICLLIQPFMMLVGFISTTVSDNEIAGVVGDMITDGGLLMTVGVIAVVPSVFEELAVRGPAIAGHVARGKSGRGYIIAVAVINGVFFGMLHLDLQQFLYTAVLGGVFALFVIYTKSLIAPMLGHFVINGSQSGLMAFALWSEENLPVQENYVGAEASEMSVLVTLFFLVVITLPFAVWILVSFIKRNTVACSEPVDGGAFEAAYEKRGDWRELITWELALVAALYGAMILLLYLP